MIKDQIGSINDIFTFFALLLGVVALFGAIVFLPLSEETIKAYRAYILIAYQITVLCFVLVYLTRFCRDRGISVLDRLEIKFEFRFGPAIAIYAISTIVICMLYTLIFMRTKFGMGLDSLFVMENIKGGSLAVLSLTGLSGLALGPITEEITDRGFVYPILRKRYGVFKGIIITSLLFSILHKFGEPSLILNVILFFQFFVAGVLFNIIFEREKNLLWCIVFHAFMNLLILIFGYSVKPL